MKFWANFSYNSWNYQGKFMNILRNVKEIFYN